MGKRSSQNGEWPWATGAHAAAWHEAARMFGRVSSGEDLTPYAPPPGLLLEPGETVFCEGMVEYSRYYGMDVTYTHRSTFAWGGPVFVAAALIGSAAGNAAARGRAERMAVPQWRFEGFPTVLVTRHRLLISHPGHYQWLSFWHSAMIEFGPDVQAYALYLGFPGCAPVMLRGPMVP